YNLPSYYIRNNVSIRQFYYTTIFNKMLKVTILIRVEINVILETRSGSVSNSIAYIVVVAAVGIAEIIMSTAAIIGSTSTIETNIQAIIGAAIIFNVTLEITTFQFNFNPIIEPNCIPSINIITVMAASPTIDSVDIIGSGTDI